MISSKIEVARNIFVKYVMHPDFQTNIWKKKWCVWYVITWGL